MKIFTEIHNVLSALPYLFVDILSRLDLEGSFPSSPGHSRARALEVSPDTTTPLCTHEGISTPLLHAGDIFYSPDLTEKVKNFICKFKFSEH